MTKKTKIITIITTVFISIIIALSYVIKPPTKKASADEIYYEYNGSNFTTPIFVGGGNGITNSITLNITNTFKKAKYNNEEVFMFQYGYKPTENWSYWGIQSNTEIISTVNNSGVKYGNGTYPMQYTIGAVYRVNPDNTNHEEYTTKENGYYIQEFGSKWIYEQQEMQEYPDLSSNQDYSIDIYIEVTQNFNCNPINVKIEKVTNIYNISYGASFTYMDNNGEYVRIIYNLYNPMITDAGNIKLDTRTYYFNREVQNQYDNGYKAGLKANNSDAFDKGFSKGYNKGIEDGNGNEWLKLFGALIDVPINVLVGKYDSETQTRVGGLLNFEIFGYNMSNLATMVLTLGIIMFLLRIIKGRLDNE